MKEYRPVQFLAYLVELCNDKILQLNVRKFNEKLDKIHDSLWNQHFHIGFGFNTFCDICSTRFPEWIYFDNEKFILTINKDEEFEKNLGSYITIYEMPDIFENTYEKVEDNAK